MCAAWTLITSRLTTTFWSGVWRSGPFRDEALSRLQERLGEVLTLRTVHHQLTGLVTEGRLEPPPGCQSELCRLRPRTHGRTVELSAMSVTRWLDGRTA